MQVPVACIATLLISCCVVLSTKRQAAAQIRPDVDPGIAALVADVSPARLQRDVARLASFGTRHSLSDPSSATRGIGAAREWIFRELQQSSPKLQVSFDSHRVAPQGRIPREVELLNVMAVLPGKSARRIYVTAHYDTVSVGPAGQIGLNTAPAGQPRASSAEPNYEIDAPGANDNGSGTALTLELARVLANSERQFDATIVFMLWAGEEQGLVGSRAHAQRLGADGVPVTAVFNSDIVGGSRGGNGVIDAESVRVYSEGPEDSMSRSLARHVLRSAALYAPEQRVRLIARHDRFGRGSDHSSFNQHGYPAVVFRESNENFARQHAPADTPDGVDYEYLARNTRVNAAAVASLALAPPAPEVVDERGVNRLGRQPSGYDAHLQWNRAPGAVAYRVYWREAWGNDWQQHRLIGDVDRLVISGLSIDDFVFGVAAVGPGGHESLVSAYVSPLRREPEVKLVP